ncbi:hypothetical protein [Nocardia vermiculata]|nr:hypothetical protein [Nocardia vermiculata]
MNEAEIMNSEQFEQDAMLVNWPEHSPLESWWVEVMNHEVPLR